MKRIFRGMKKIVFMILLFVSISLFSGIQIYSADLYCEFSPTKRTIEKKILKDFDGNPFFLYELENGYAIYAIENDKEIFIEGSYKSNSIYSTIENASELFYLGPGKYFYQNQNNVYNIMSGEVHQRDEVHGAYRLNSTSYEVSLTKQSNTNYSSHIDENAFTVVKEDKYFKNLISFPQNWFGECGLVALSILLGYLDTFHNDYFIPNGKTYSAKYYIDNNNVDEDGDEIYDSVIISEEELIKKVEYIYVEGETYGLEEWPSLRMPGTNYALRDYLLDNYLHTYGIWDKPGSKNLKKNQPSPMADEELKKTFNDYVNNNCSHLANSINIRSGNVFFTHQHPKDYIDLGIPTILVLANYTYSRGDSEKEKWHDVVAYGYKDDKFLVHMGWWPNYQNYTEIVISDATIYGYFAPEYEGTHVHSQNIYMKNNDEVFWICGCGHKHHHIYDYDYLNDFQHSVSCSCGISFIEPHDWKFLKGKTFIKPTVRYCEKCGISVPL